MTTITDEALEQIRQLYAENFFLRDALLNPNPDDEPDVVRLHREKCDALDRITQLAAENERLREALELFADPAAWRRGGSCDPNSGAFRGQEVASAVLSRTGET